MTNARVHVSISGSGGRGGGELCNIKCVLTFSTPCLKYFSFYEEFSDILS
jgi:hypothetical protein